MFKYDWSLFNVKLGVIFMLGTLAVFSLQGQLEFPMMASGISALLAWLTIIMIPHRRRKQHLAGLMAYLVIGTVLTWVAGVLAPYPWARISSMVFVTFGGYLMLLRSSHSFVVAWCLAYWYMLTPLFLGPNTLGAVVLGHVLGAGIVVLLNFLKPVWSSVSDQDEASIEAFEKADRERPPVGFVVRYAAVVACTIGVGLGAGMRWLTSDPTLVANASFNMISPSLKQTWIGAIVRLVLGCAGVLGGFYFGWFFPEPWVGYLVAIVTSFLTLGVLSINLALGIGILFFLLSYSWGSMQSEQGHLIANEKLLGELVGIAVAVVAIAILTQFRTVQSTK